MLLIFYLLLLTGNGKTYYIHKTMDAAGLPSVDLVVNEAFDYCVAIDQLNSLKSLQKCYVHVNVTAFPPLAHTETQDKNGTKVRTEKLVDTCFLFVIRCPGWNVLRRDPLKMKLVISFHWGFYLVLKILHQLKSKFSENHHMHVYKTLQISQILSWTGDLHRSFSKDGA